MGLEDTDSENENSSETLSNSENEDNFSQVNYALKFYFHKGFDYFILWDFIFVQTIFVSDKVITWIQYWE